MRKKVFNMLASHADITYTDAPADTAAAEVDAAAQLTPTSNVIEGVTAPASVQ